MNPNKFIGTLICSSAALLLITVFGYHLEETPLAYFSYLYSTYALIIFCIWFYKACQFTNDWMKKTTFYNWYHNNDIRIIKISLICSLVMNFVYGIFELTIGIYYSSWWFITFAIYYLMLFLMKLSLFKEENNSKDDYMKLKNTGISLLFLNLILTGVIILVINQDKTISYSGYLIYIVALYDFYLIISAIIKVLKYKVNKNPIIIARKCISLSVAMISMLSLEVAMIYQFGNNDSNFKLVMVSFTGFGIVFVNTIMSIIMIIKANKVISR